MRAHPYLFAKIFGIIDLNAEHCDLVSIFSYLIIMSSCL